MKSKLKNKELEFFKEFHELLRKYRASIVVALDDSATVLIAGRKLKNLEATPYGVTVQGIGEYSWEDVLVAGRRCPEVQRRKIYDLAYG